MGELGGSLLYRWSWSWFLVLWFLNNLIICVPQENGQRRYGGPPPDWEGPPPERGSEIFVGKLPRDLFEDELVPLCEKVRSCCITQAK